MMVRSERPSTSITQENIETIHRLVLNNTHIKGRELEETTGLEVIKLLNSAEHEICPAKKKKKKKKKKKEKKNQITNICKFFLKHS